MPLPKDIETILNYMWKDELQDYMDHNEDVKSEIDATKKAMNDHTHIFGALVRVEKTFKQS